MTEDSSQTCLNFVFISPHCPPHFKYFVSRLNALPNVRVFGVGDVPYDALDPQLASDLSDYAYVPNMEDYGQVYDAVAEFIHKHGGISFVESHNEHWLDLEARLRQDFGISSGYHVDEICTYQQKDIAKDMYRQIGVNVAEGTIVNTIEDARGFIETTQIGYPVIIKTNVGVGCTGVFKILDDNELQNFFEHQKEENKQYLLEQFIDAVTITFDGLTDHHGNIVFYACTEYCDLVIETKATKKEASCFIHRQVPDDVREMGEKVIRAFNVRSRFFHIEIFRNKSDGRLIMLESNLRLPGGLIPDMWNHAHDIDIYSEYADMITCRDKYALSQSDPSSQAAIYPIHNPPYYCCFVGRRPEFEYAHSHDDIMNHPEFGPMVVQSHELPPLFRGMGDYAYIFRCTEMDPMLRAWDFITQHATSSSTTETETTQN